MIAAFRPSLRPVVWAFLLALSPGLAKAEPCVWANGQDRTGPADDPGRGTLDSAAHHSYVASGPGVQRAHKLVGDRMGALKACLDKTAYAKLYADLSVAIAKVGVEKGGWGAPRDAPPAGDGGRGIQDWNAHNAFAASDAGAAAAQGFVTARMQALSAKIAKEAYASLYADVSIIEATAAQKSAAATPALAGSPAAGDPSAYARSDGVNAVVYRGAGDHVFELYLVGTTWKTGDLTDITKAPAAASDPSPYARADGVSSVEYRSEDGHVRELWLKGTTWSFGDLQ
jgi:hypothetical protein